MQTKRPKGEHKKDNYHKSLSLGVTLFFALKSNNAEKRSGALQGTKVSTLNGLKLSLMLKTKHLQPIKLD